MQQYFSFINEATNKLTIYVNCFYFIKYLKIKYSQQQGKPGKSGIFKKAATKSHEKLITVKFRESQILIDQTYKNQKLS